jgi:hypothetical protein
MKKLYLSLLSAIIFTGCAMPETIVKTVDSRPQLAIKDAPKESILYVDGLKIGEATIYNGKPKTLIIEPGTHMISVKTPQGDFLYNQKIFVESELKTITIIEQK